MAAVSVTIVLNKLQSFLQSEFFASLFTDEEQIVTEFRRDMWSIKNQMDHMKAILRDANARNCTITEEQQECINQVRDVVHEAEDFFDEFQLQVSLQHRRGLLYSFLHKIYPFVKSFGARHKAALEMQTIKFKVKDVLERSSTSGGNVGNESETDTRPDPRQNALFLDDHEIVGLEEPSQKLIEWLLQGGSELQVVSVYGMAGLGKTTLVKKVYDNETVKQHFEMHAWVTASESMDITQILKEMIQQLYGESRRQVPQGLEMMKSHEMKFKIKEFLSQSKTYILVLDGIWNRKAWDAIKNSLPKNSNGRLMLTTRDKDLADASIKQFTGHCYELGFLSRENSSKLFNRTIFQGDQCPPDFEEISKNILDKCQGLPLAIVAISGLLLTKNQPEDWSTICSSFGKEIESNDKLEDLKGVLLLSYNYLPGYLKPCFLYLSIFPKEDPIECTRLTRLWIAEGFIVEKEGCTLEQVAVEYLNELLNRSLMQVAETTSDGRVKSCRLHELLREIIISKSRAENFALIAREQATDWPETVRRLSIQSTMQHLQPNRNLPKLRSLFMFGGAQESSASTLFPGGFRLLNVLDLQAARLEIFPTEVVSLFHLKYLSFRGTKLKKIPGSIKKLQNLETLDLKNACVTDLPPEIQKLRRLKHLLVYRYDVKSYARFDAKHGFKASIKLGCLKSLQKLCYVEVNQCNHVLITELGKLNSLTRLGITKLRKKDGKVLCSVIANLGNLRALSVSSAQEREIIDLQDLKAPPRFLLRLYLTGRLLEIPQWIKSLQKLQRLYLKWSQLTYDPLDDLQNLPQLIHLELLQAFDGRELCFKADKFPKLKFLGLDKFEELVSLKVEEGAMPLLEKLIIQRCELMEEMPSGIEHLRNLKFLEFSGMPDDFIRKVRPQEQGNVYETIRHIPEVYSSRWKDESWDLEKLNNEGLPTHIGSVIRSHQIRYCWK